MMASSASAMASASTAAVASSSSSNSPCAACKFLRRKCQPDCVFAPYFPPDQPQKFANVHKVFGASNVTKLLNELRPCQREDAVNSLAYEAEMRLRDPVYGCVGVISILQHNLRQLQLDLVRARSELNRYHATAAAAAAAVAANAASTTDNTTVGLSNVNHPGVNGIEFFRPTPAARVDAHINQLTLTTTHQESEMAATAARVGVHGICDAGFVAAMNSMAPAAVNVGPLAFQFSRPRTAGVVDERQTIGPS